MEFRQLGHSGTTVSTISFGSWLTYAGGIERERSEACIRAAFDLGITFFDTANVYGQGLAPAQVHRQLDASLKRLRTDYVDVYYCHRFDPKVPVADTLGR